MSVSEAQKIKGLRTQLQRIEGEVSALKTEIGSKQKELNLKIKTIDQIKKALSKINGSGQIKVSEHAILRYLERVKGIDISEAEREILSEGVIKMVETLGGTGTYPNGGFRVVMKQNTVTTVILD